MEYRSRGLLAGMSAGELRQRIERQPYREYWERMVRRWREVAEWETRTGQMVNIGSCGGGQVTWLVTEAGLIYRLSGEPGALAWVERQIDKLAELYLYKPEKRTQLFGRGRPYWSHLNLCLAADLCRGSLGERSTSDLMRVHGACPDSARQIRQAYGRLDGRWTAAGAET